MSRRPNPLPVTIMLKHGTHAKPEHGMCLMEAVAYVANEPHSDMPGCACPVLSEYARTINDNAHWKNDAARTSLLLPLVPKLVGSRGDLDEQIERACYLSGAAAQSIESFSDFAEANECGEECASLCAVAHAEALVAQRTAAVARKNRCYTSSLQAAHIAADALECLAEAASAADAYVGRPQGRCVAYVMTCAATALSEAIEI